MPSWSTSRCPRAAASTRSRRCGPAPPTCRSSSWPGSDDEELALRALGVGASDYLLKGRVTGDLVARAVQYAIERERLLVAERESRRDAEAARDDALQTQRALETSEKRRRALLGSMLRAEEAERQRIAVELHDDTIQVMVAALVGMDACQATIDRDDPGGALESMARARATLAEAVDRVRRMSFELRPPLLDAQGLGSAASDLVDEVAAECALETQVDVSLRRYAPEIEILAYRTLRELIANVRKHARANRLELRMHEQATAIVCVLTDDGVGFDSRRFELPAGRRGMRLHLGLDATIERVRIAGGTFAIDSGSARRHDACGSRCRSTARETSGRGRLTPARIVGVRLAPGCGSPPGA